MQKQPFFVKFGANTSKLNNFTAPRGRYFYTQNQRKRGKAMEPEKKTPEEEKKPAPAAEQKDEPKPEEKPAENKQTDDNGMAEKAPVINKQTA
ncbi:hypothetical protein EUBSIR_01915 [[Eubacterium] siraeum DSM 15702]|uniref:Uncharacterized protein n=1 Tax=[Eubacterium] siraeum DSM 15702 TaxID=428128 RepID=B0MPW2_9FIRM|nr:hypothetical protein EUBSIR_01915 [[Eubacterium] siraeum DSM 15702]